MIASSTVSKILVVSDSFFAFQNCGFIITWALIYIVCMYYVYLLGRFSEFPKCWWQWWKAAFRQLVETRKNLIGFVPEAFPSRVMIVILHFRSVVEYPRKNRISKFDVSVGYDLLSTNPIFHTSHTFVLLVDYKHLLPRKHPFSQERIEICNVSFKLTFAATTRMSALPYMFSLVLSLQSLHRTQNRLFFNY